MNDFSKIANLILISIIGILAIIIAELNLIDNIKAANTEEVRLFCGVTAEDNLSRRKKGVRLNLTGKSLFENNCVICHEINEQVVGPALLKITERRDRKWLYQMISNSQKLIESGDSTAINIYEMFGKAKMPPFDFTTSELDSIIDYIDCYY
ncbi:c-type cytochrome [Aureibacter tunicatorum]|uniref:Cytochrome c551/c552 n=1 Tax=Aureibacter tunicatorum TaxID=866807 RepID=A0AAE3XRX1_9BACT|nr:c-type cytochrome [Aureibacter tunicatorum]MDR6240840.1 cytochrome c551/c552 [Aureibacter tunicatorum]BDD06827.1 hypothetical protein AUTU_43100 [Aureibacter tunicatorum]